METVTDGIKTEQKVTDKNEKHKNDERGTKTDENRGLVSFHEKPTFENLENGKENQIQNIFKMEEDRLKKNESKDHAFETIDSTKKIVQEQHVSDISDITPSFSDVIKPNDKSDSSSTKSFTKRNSDSKINANFEYTNGHSNVSISESSLRTSSQYRTPQLSISISSAQSIDSQAPIEEKNNVEKDTNSSEETSCSLPKRKKSSDKPSEKKSFTSKIPTISGVSPARAKVISIPLSPVAVKEDKRQVSWQIYSNNNNNYYYCYYYYNKSLMITPLKGLFNVI